MATQQERRDASCQTIVAAAARAIAEHGVDGFTISAVARASGLNRATIYHYFPNRADLVASALRYTLAQQAVPRPEPGRATLEERMRAHVKSPDLARFLVSVLLQGEPLPRLPGLEQGVELIRKGQQTGTMRAEIDAELFAAVLWMAEMTWVVGREAIAGNLDIAVEEADERLVRELNRLAADGAVRPRRTAPSADGRQAK